MIQLYRFVSLWPFDLFTSANLELLHTATQDFSLCFGTVDRIVNFLIGHCCIITQMYYFQVFLSHSVLVLSFSVRSQSHQRRALWVSNLTKLVALKWPKSTLFFRWAFPFPHLPLYTQCLHSLLWQTFDIFPHCLYEFFISLSLSIYVCVNTGSSVLQLFPRGYGSLCQQHWWKASDQATPSTTATAWQWGMLVLVVGIDYFF